MSMNLSKTERLMMTEIYLEATKKGGNCLIKPIDLLTRIPYSVEFKANDLDDTLQALVYDEYIEMVETEKKGEPYYCFTLLKKGKAFKREIVLQRRNQNYTLMLKIAIPLAVAVIGTLIKILINKTAS